MPFTIKEVAFTNLAQLWLEYLAISLSLHYSVIESHQ